MSDDNRDFYLNTLKSIVKVNSGYILQKVYEEDENGNIRPTSEHEANQNKNQFSKNCNRCIHSCNGNCEIRTMLERCPENSYIPCHWTANCDAYLATFPLNIIKSETEMVDFIERAENLFDYPEDYESYFGFERNWDEETGDILETVREYYNRGGEFTKIPTEYPCVIRFDWDCEDDLEWIYIGK